MNRAAFLFPGQGSQFVGMGKEVCDAYPAARAVYEEANEALGMDLARISFEGPEEELKKTRNTQPAILTHSVAVLAVLRERGVEPRAAAGHSLGEYSAYVAAGALAFPDAARLVRRRGELMYEAGLRRPGAMAAVLGLSAREVSTLCESVEVGTVCAANLNSPTQVVISGDPEAVRRAMERAKEAGAKRAVELSVSGAFHSPLMEPAYLGLREALAAVPIGPARIPVLANATAAAVQEPEEIRESLARQLLCPVRWEESVRALLADPGPPFLEVGPGSVLKGLVRALDREAVCLAVGDPAGIEEAVAQAAAGSRGSRS
jgi:[acyl-carrier-protein] S-malonyltransferase